MGEYKPGLASPLSIAKLAQMLLPVPYSPTANEDRADAAWGLASSLYNTATAPGRALEGNVADPIQEGNDFALNMMGGGSMVPAEAGALNANRLAVALRDANGKLIKGRPGELHPDLYQRELGSWDDYDTGKYTEGFTTEDGNFLNRAEALEWVKANEKDAAARLKAANEYRYRENNLEASGYFGDNDLYANKAKGAGLVVAFKNKDGTVVMGKPGQWHPDLFPKQLTRKWLQSNTSGWATSDGKFLTREEALKWVNKNEPELQKKEDLTHGYEGKLEAGAYWQAKDK